MKYGKDKQKDNEEFPKVMNREDTKELVSIIENINSQAEPNAKIGLNLQYRQVKIPSNTFFALSFGLSP